eukprot:gi/632984751/ref/XP_007909299.1/ PREDICTED: putative golgin subfamily A member 6-like protein 6 isoform X2 [Callorhinchus milii]
MEIRHRDELMRVQNRHRAANIEKIIANEAKDRMRSRDMNANGLIHLERNCMPGIWVQVMGYLRLFIIARLLGALTVSAFHIFTQAQKERRDLVERATEEESRAHEELIMEKHLRETKIRNLEVALEEERRKFLEEEKAMARRLQEQQRSLIEEYQMKTAAMERQIKAQHEKPDLMVRVREDESRAHHALIEETRLLEEKIRLLEASLFEEKKKSLKKPEAIAHTMQEQQRSLRQEFQEKATAMEQEIRAQHEKIELVQRERDEESWAHQQLIQKTRLKEEMIRHLEANLEEEKRITLEEQRATSRKLQEQQRSLRKEFQEKSVVMERQIRDEAFIRAQQEKQKRDERIIVEESRIHKQLIEEKHLSEEKIQHLEFALEEEKLKTLEEKKATASKLDELHRLLSQEFQEMTKEKERQIRDETYGGYVAYRRGEACDGDSDASYHLYQMGLISILLLLTNPGLWLWRKKQQTILSVQVGLSKKGNDV